MTASPQASGIDVYDPVNKVSKHLQPVSRGPGLPANLTRATKPALIDAVQRAWAELAEARSLLRAIAELAELPRPSIIGTDQREYHNRVVAFADAQKTRAIQIAGSAGYDGHLDVAEKVLRLQAAEQDLGYVPRIEAPDAVS